MQRIVFFVLSCFLPFYGFTQSAVEGKVIDAETKAPLPFATIGVKGTPYGTIANEDGVFRMSRIAETDTLVVGFLGYFSQELLPKDLRENGIVLMKPKAIQIKTFTVSGDSEPYFDIIVACRKRLLKKSRLECKAYLELHTQVNDTRSEIIEMYYNADLRSGNMNALTYKSGRQAIAKVNNSFFLNLSTSSIFQKFNLVVGDVDMPDSPLEMNKKGMMKTYELSLLSSDDDDYYHLMFKPKTDENKIFGGEIWIEKETFNPIEIKLKIEQAVVKPFIPIFPTDSLADIFMQITQRFDVFDDVLVPSLQRFEYGFDSYTPYDTRFPISPRNLGAIKPIRSDGVMYYYDYDQPFIKPKYKYVVELNDYQKIQNTPYHANFWNVESALVESDRMEQSLSFFKQYGRLSNQGSTQLDDLFLGMGTYMDHTNSFWSDSLRLRVNTDFLNTEVSSHEGFHSVPIRSRYQLSTQVYLDVVETSDTLFYFTETVFDIYNSFYNLESDSMTNVFVNLYFDLAEVARREIEKEIESLETLSVERINAIYDKQMTALYYRQQRYLDETSSGRNIEALQKYNSEIKESLSVDNFEVFQID
jgi:hypothetical protein